MMDGGGERSSPPPSSPPPCSPPPPLPPLPSTASSSVLLRLWPACRHHAPRRPSVRFEPLSPPPPPPSPLKPASNKATVTRISMAAAAAGGEAAPGNRRGKQAARADFKCTSEGRQEEAASEPSCPGTSAYRQEVGGGAGRVWEGRMS